MTGPFMNMYGLKIEKSIKKAYSNVLKKFTCNIRFGYHYDHVIAPCLPRFQYSVFADGKGSKRLNFQAPASIRICPNTLPGVIMRHYCTRHDDDFPLLTRQRCRGSASVLASFSNFFLTYLVIKPQLDKSFSANEFLYTTRKVVEVVSSRIAEGNFEALQDLMTTDVLEEIKSNLTKFSANQRQDLVITEEEIVYSFLDTITLNVDNESNTKSLEVLTIHHAFKGIKEMKKITENITPMNIESVQKKILKNTPRPFVLNYRFLRKFYSSGEASDWIINGVQHQSGKSMTMNNFF